MYKGFPVGNLLFWANTFANENNRVIGTDRKQKIPRLVIVDGQQRLTSLYAVMKNEAVIGTDYAPRQISIAFNPSTESFAVTDAAIQHNPEFIPDISEMLNSQTTQIRFVNEFLDNLRRYKGTLTKKEEDRISDSISRLYDLLSYQFYVMELSATVDEEVVADIFVRTNSAGTELNQSDFILTLMSVFWDDGRKELENFCRASFQVPSKANQASPFNHFIKPLPDDMLRVSVALGFRRAVLKYVYMLLRGKDLKTGQFSEKQRVEQFDILQDSQAYVLDLKNWHEFLKVLLHAGFRSEQMISSKLNILFSYSMYLIAQRDYGLNRHDLRKLIGRWYFMTSLTSRYSASPESTMEYDLSNMPKKKTADAFIDTFNRIIDDTLTKDYWKITLPNELTTSAARSPAMFAYYAALNVMNASLLFSRVKVSELLDPNLKPTRSPIERHHLFPKKYLKKIGVADPKDINQAANYALLEWPDNSDISEKSPLEYYPKYKARVTEDMQYWHALPDGWEKMKYSNFLQERRKMIADVIKDAFEKLPR